MQTGPAPRQSMQRWLVWTGVGELASVAVFLVVFRQMGNIAPALNGPIASVGLATLAVVLIEGSLYWFGKRFRLGQPLAPYVQLNALKALYVANYVLLLVFPVFVVGLATNAVPFRLNELLFGLFLYGFGLGEFIHYFVRKINMRPAERQRQRAAGRAIPARFRRELVRLTNDQRPTTNDD